MCNSMKGAGILVGNFEVNPLGKGDQSGRSPTFFRRLKAIILNFDYMNQVNNTN